MAEEIAHGKVDPESSADKNSGTDSGKPSRRSQLLAQLNPSVLKLNSNLEKSGAT